MVGGPLNFILGMLLSRRKFFKKWREERAAARSRWARAWADFGLVYDIWWRVVVPIFVLYVVLAWTLCLTGLVRCFG